ncbi:site-specific integrase [Chryseobacterium arthrosphaerae]|uniref:site-specific integrase n=1 Tax=Chryseobacterium arthrosphaerae TaxID=651561 RepID=UPI0023E180BF|nr:site-specific integrase [Chryseobacterium arthrosphaerae]WES98489.1 site-specific integrase [Chryseobacterium arthrosphaerae]
MKNTRIVYLRITVDGIPKEVSTRRKWDASRWNQTLERASGTREDAKSINYFLDSLINNLANYRTELINQNYTITSQLLIDFVKDKTVSKTKVLEEFQLHNDEMLALVETGEYAIGTHDRFVTARSHVQEFMKAKYNRYDMEFRELNYSFIKDYEMYLKTIRKCNNNTTLKYISNFKKIVLIAIVKGIIPANPFQLFKSRYSKNRKQPLSQAELRRLENKKFESERLSVIRDVFVFQCYTGLSYIDVFNLKIADIKDGVDGKVWIISDRQKSKSDFDVPLLSKAVEIIKIPKSSNMYCTWFFTSCKIKPKNE